MQLIQIGAPRQKTILDLIREMSERQAYEIEQLKRAACERARRKHRQSKQRFRSRQSDGSSS